MNTISNHICIRRTIHKILIKKVIFESAQHPSQFVVPASDTLAVAGSIIFSRGPFLSIVAFGCSWLGSWCSMTSDCVLLENKLAKSLQARMPSVHVWSKFALVTPPQLLNQAPPRAQQLLWPDFLVVTHLGHTEPLVIVVVSTTDEMQA